MSVAVHARSHKSTEKQLHTAYSICRGIARRRARNFYYGFMVLPIEKRNAISAVYAFMRHCDDIADDAAFSPGEKLRALNHYRSVMHDVLDGQHTDDPVLLALADVQHHFAISRNLLDHLVTGTVMDVETPVSTDGVPAAPYNTFDDLRRYCYHVASVVGLVSIRIFGYRDTSAEPLAEDCGVAFQLTNIIRDVKEDAQMGRIYLPVEDLQRFGQSPEDLAPTRLGSSANVAGLRPLLEFETERARQFYRAADELLPLIDEDAQPALWVLVEIYRRLLDRIVQQGYDVFKDRVRLSRPEKLRILARGFAQRLL
jgi:15-cis-phytoene synthase